MVLSRADVDKLCFSSIWIILCYWKVKSLGYAEPAAIVTLYLTMASSRILAAGRCGEILLIGWIVKNPHFFPVNRMIWMSWHHWLIHTGFAGINLKTENKTKVKCWRAQTAPTAQYVCLHSYRPCLRNLTWGFDCNIIAKRWTVKSTVNPDIPPFQFICFPGYFSFIFLWPLPKNRLCIWVTNLVAWWWGAQQFHSNSFTLWHCMKLPPCNRSPPATHQVDSSPTEHTCVTSTAPL